MNCPHCGSTDNKDGRCFSLDCAHARIAALEAQVNARYWEAIRVDNTALRAERDQLRGEVEAGREQEKPRLWSFARAANSEKRTAALWGVVMASTAPDARAVLSRLHRGEDWSGVQMREERGPVALVGVVANKDATNG